MIRYTNESEMIISKYCGVGGVNSKNFAVTGIIGNINVAANADTDKNIIAFYGQPAFSIGNSERMEKRKRISVSTLAINQLVCKTSGEIL